ncbi:MAG TPA: porin [Candidatus Gastranaerophilales bacterium]|nr:porin [Candidatus Gastranaerophilales bacterium]
MVGESGKKFDVNAPISRNEAAVLFVNLVGKIEEKNIKLSEAEKAKIEILHQELGAEIDELSGRVKELESGFDVLKGRVSNLEDQNKKLWGHNFGEDFKITGGLQTVFYGNLEKGDNRTPSNFSLPWAEVNFSGKMHDHVEYFAKVVPTRNFTDSRNGILEDVFVKTDIVPHHSVYLGQLAVPFGIEAPMSPMDIDFIEYSQTALKLGKGYDTGVMTEGDWGFVKYSAGAFNGGGQNATDPNRSMSLAGQLTFLPLYKSSKYGDLQLGGSFLDGNTLVDHYSGYGAHASYNIGKLTLKSEYMAVDRSTEVNNRDSGWRMDVKYQLTDKLQALGRYDTYNPTNAQNNDTLNAYTLGTNYAFTDNLLLMVNYSLVDSATGQNSNRLGLLTQVMF